MTQGEKTQPDGKRDYGAQSQHGLAVLAEEERLWLRERLVLSFG
jgi:hypothetical protein